MGVSWRCAILAACLCAASFAQLNQPMIDPDTPQADRTTTSYQDSSLTFNLVFSDEFEVAGRNFSAGQQTWWTAMDLANVATNDWEYYSPEAVTTEGGALIITASDKSIMPGYPYTSGMLQSWNQFCFTGGILEIEAQLPGTGRHTGFWPAAWMVGNLGRVAYMQSTASMWPWSYDVCDKNSQWQRLSACDSTPPDGLLPNQGRGAPEIDLFESRIGGAPTHPYVNLTQATLLNTAHFTPKNPTNITYNEGITINNSTQEINVGGDYLHDFIGSITPIAEDFYTAMHTYRLEWYPEEKISWWVDGEFVFEITEETLHAVNTSTWDVGQRLISTEPMYIIMNLALSPIWEPVNVDLEWPGLLKIGHVRVFQQPGMEQTSCSPADYPTAEYINNNINLYTNPSP